MQNHNRLNSDKEYGEPLTVSPVPAKTPLPEQSFRWLSFAVIICVCFMMYGQTVRFGFTGLDDDMMIGMIIDRGAHAGQAFTTDAFLEKGGCSFYRPLQTLSYILDGSWTGKDPLAYHVSNLIIFTLACCTLLSFLRCLGLDRRFAFAVTLLYTTHPLFAQVAAWIPARGDLLLTLFSMLSVIALIQYRNSGRWELCVVHLCTFVLAVLSKETAVVLPAIFAATLWIVNRKQPERRLDTALCVVSWIVIVGCFLLLRKAAIPGLPQESSFGFKALLSNWATLPENLANFIWPIDLAVLPSFTAWRTLMGLAFIGVITVISIVQKNRSLPLIIFGSIWFVCLSIPGMLYSHELGRYAYNYLHHRTFLPLVGILIVLTQILPSSWRAMTAKAPWISIIILTAIGISLSFRQARVFIDPVSFYDHAISTNPDSAFAITNRGKLKAARGQFHDAIDDYNKALSLLPSYNMARNNLANAKGLLGDYGSAIRELSEVIRRQPSYSIAYNNRGKWKFNVNDYDGAAADYDEAIRLDPELATAYSNRGELKGVRGDSDGALQDMEKALLLNPLIADTWYKIGVFRAVRGATAEACANLRQAAQLGHSQAAAVVRQYCK